MKQIIANFWKKINIDLEDYPILRWQHTGFLVDRVGYTCLYYPSKSEKDNGIDFKKSVKESVILLFGYI